MDSSSDEVEWSRGMDRSDMVLGQEDGGQQLLEGNLETLLPVDARLDKIQFHLLAIDL